MRIISNKPDIRIDTINIFENYSSKLMGKMFFMICFITLITTFVFFFFFFYIYIYIFDFAR